MRDFTRTGEPKGAQRDPAASRPGAAAGQRGASFVIQQHAARRMHYDFRLELDGVLLSWSVPKGPSLSPKERRLAVRTEDHPLDYADFEGIIPKGQYGGGTVVVWDRGTWEPAEGADARAAVDQGKLTFTLHGEKLHGRWHLVRTKPAGKAENWLLFKGRDEAADDKSDIVADRPESVLSGRTVEQIAEAPERVWHSDRAAEPTVAEKRAARIEASGKRTAGSSDGDVRSLVEQLPLGFPLTNLDKVLYPDVGLTKAQLIAYLAVVADHALPYLADRPLMLMRCPDGIAPAKPHGRAKCFVQKHVLKGAPEPIDSVSIADSDGSTGEYMQVHDMPGLVALAQLGSLEIHTWGSRSDDIERPDLIVFDLDPDVGLGWDRVVAAALELRRRLREVDLDSFVKTTGGKGLHVVVPIARGPSWDEVEAFSEAIAAALEHDEPALYTTNMAKAQRKGKIYLDYLRNSRGATFIAPYSPRARAGAPVAVPISWDELAHGVDPAAFTTSSVPRRLATLREDPWQALPGLAQSLTQLRPLGPRALRAQGARR